MILPFTGASAEVPAVAPGGVLHFDERGFEPHVEVVAVVAGNAASRQIETSDSSGRVRGTVHAPGRAGSYRLEVAGAAADPSGPTDLPTGPGDDQVVAVRVPRLVTLPFTVQPGSGVLGISTSAPGPAGAGHGVESETAPNTADTGVDALALMLAGILAILAGSGLAIVARRRRAGTMGSCRDVC